MRKLLLLLAFISFPAIAATYVVSGFPVTSGSDQLCGWDESATDTACFTLGSGLTTSGTVLSSTITQYTDEMAQDAIGAMVDSTLVYVDATPLLTRAAITGDVSIPQTSNTATLATVNSNVGSFGSATQVGTFTVTGTGLITAAGNTTVTPAVTSITGLAVGMSTFLASATSGNLAATVTNETGSSGGGVLVFNVSPQITTPNFTTGFTIGASATSGKFIVGNGTNFVASTSTIPTSAGATAGKVLVSDGTNYVLSTPTFPNASATAGKFIRSDGTNWIASTPTLPTAAGGAGTVLRSDGTNYLTSGFTIVDTGTSGGIPYYSASGAISSSAALAANAVVVGGGAGTTPATTGVSIDTNNLISGYKGNINAQTGTTYTLDPTDTGKIVELNNGSAITVTLPNSLAQGFTCRIVQTGAGQVTLSPAGGATLNNHSSFTKTAGQWSEVDVYVTTNSGGTSAVYVMAGDGA